MNRTSAATELGGIPLGDGATLRTEVVVVGSGAGGATTAVALAESGYDVLILEEGLNVDTSRMNSNSIEAISTLYRNGGLTPTLGNQAVAYVEGRCVGGSTEINSGFWHRLPLATYDRWEADVQVVGLSERELDPYFERLERDLSVSSGGGAIRRSSALFREGANRLGWSCVEVPRCVEAGASPFAAGAKRSMQRTYLPRALAASARLLPDCKATAILHHDGRVRGLLATIGNAPVRRVTIEADAVFVCCGAVQTPALLRRSGIKRNVGNNLRIHPMIKAAALFDEPVEAIETAVPLYQVKEFSPGITIGGAVFTPGFLAMILAENWTMHQRVMADWSRMAIYYAAVRGMKQGTVRVIPKVSDGAVVRYSLAEADQRNLSIGLAHLGELLFAAGARAVFPSISSFPVLRSADQCRGLLKHYPAVSTMGLSTVHAFSSCPMGENADVCATDSFGRVRGFHNLYVNDASLLPDSPGVNPQGTTMAIALRNAEAFVDAGRRARRGQRRDDGAPPAPPIVVTGAPGWLGTRFVEALTRGIPDLDTEALVGPRTPIRCLVQRGTDAAGLSALDERITSCAGDLGDRESLRELMRGAAGGILVHIAGLVHPERFTRDFERVNVAGTRHLLEAAEEAGVKRAVVVSSNSPIGCNPHAEHRFDERSPYHPYMGYGRSKARMEALVHDVQARGRLETVIIRPPWFYGPHQPARQTLFFTMIKNGKFPILGDGTQRRSMAYVDNICQGLALAAMAAQANGETYWIADAQPYTLNEIVDTVESVLENDFDLACAHRRFRLPAIVGEVARLSDRCLQGVGLYHQKIHVLGEMHQTIACSIEKAERELGYRPRVALREGMRRSVEWCLENGLWI